MKEQRPLVGYRHWFVQKKPLYLLPLSATGYPWDIDGPTHATCAIAYYINGRELVVADKDKHPAPNRACECGLYLRPWVHPVAGDGAVAGGVQAWGRIIEHRSALRSSGGGAPRWAPVPEGVRAEWAKPVFFFAPPDKTTALIVAAIAEQLGAEIVALSPNADASRAYFGRELTAKYGASIAEYFPNPKPEKTAKKPWVKGARIAKGWQVP